MTEATEKNSKYRTLALRMPVEAYDTFNELADKYSMSASAVLRELVEGFIENRVELLPPKKVSSLYKI